LKTRNYLKVFVQTVALSIQTFINLSTLSSFVTVEWIFSKQREFDLHWVTFDWR